MSPEVYGFEMLLWFLVLVLGIVAVMFEEGKKR